MIYSSHAPHGYIALISILIISACLTLLAFSNGESTYTARLTQVYEEYQAEARALAESCIQETLLFVAEDSSFTLPQEGLTLHINDDALCMIEYLGRDHTEITMRVRGRKGLSTVSLEATVTTNEDGGLPFAHLTWRPL